MTHFPENLAALRKRAGYTQETLAETLGVSRQAVGKWESGQGLPEAATLLELAELLDCSLDQLMREPLETALEPRSQEGDPLPTWAVFSRHMDRFATAIALGVSLILLGVAMTMVVTGLLGESDLTALPILGFVTAAVFLFVFSGIDHANFQRAYPQPPTCPDPEEEAAFYARFRVGIAGSVAGILGSVALLVAAHPLLGENEARLEFATAVFFVLLSLCVGLIVHLGILRSKYEPPVVPTPGEEKWSGIIMLTATATYLLLGFVWHLWHPGWVVFPIGGILCGILNILRKD